ncbi:hypothetical protein U4Z97_09165, partial [Escherichia coli]|nr:hypothetical protein [Escherichia coli]
TADRNRSHWSTSKTPSYTKSVSWQHHPENKESFFWLMIERGIKFYRKEYLTTITEKNIMIS